MKALVDFLRYSSFVHRIYGYSCWARGVLARSTADTLMHYTAAYRVFVGLGTPKTCSGNLRTWVEDPEKASIWRDLQLGKRFYPDQECGPCVGKGIVLKAPAENERGVILISFEKNLLNLMEAENLDTLIKDYTILVFTSWFPPAYPILWQLAHYPESDVYVSISHPWETEDRGYLDSGAKILPFYMSDFINSARITPAPREVRDVDIIMVANWAPFKRHWVLFKALRDMGKPLTVVLVGQPDSGRTVDDIRAETREYGVEEMITFHNSVTVDEVVALMNRAKVSVICSKREGSCVVNAEALFCDTPIALLQGAQIGSSSYVNGQTGTFLRENHMAEDLSTFLAQCDDFSPRAWAEATIGNGVSMKRMNDQLKADAEAAGRRWTTDCATIDWWGDPNHVANDRDRLLPMYQNLKTEHNLTFKQVPVAQKALDS